MKKAFLKDVLRGITKNFNRYISIVAIVALGVAFYVGINSASPDMEKTLNKFFIDQNVFDLEILSTVGFNDTDFETIKNIAGVTEIEKRKSIDTIVKSNDKDHVVKVISIPNKSNNNNINKIQIESGKNLKNINEILIDSKMAKTLGYKIGDTIEFLGDRHQSY